MKLRGNYIVFFIIEVISGVLTFSLCWFYGDAGLFGLILFFIGMGLTMKTKVDEREMQLLYKAGSAESTVIGATMALIYFSFTSLNWFHSLISIAMVTRGISGLIVFNRE